MNLTHWAVKHGVPWVALEELRQSFNISDHREPQGASESAVQKREVLAASKAGGRLWRNNVGAYLDERGVPVRYGLCNQSKQINAVCKSSDLIGITPVLVGPSMIGHTLGVFTAREVKPEGWKYSGTKRETAQLNFLQLVASLGGDASFANGAPTS